VVFSLRTRSRQSAKCCVASRTLMVLSFTLRVYPSLAGWQAHGKAEFQILNP
jgi:hypothetical protein